jgi:DNA topoisomerase III
VSRLWISSLTPDAIRKGFEQLRPGIDYDPLADAAQGRSPADWVGKAMRLPIAGEEANRIVERAHTGQASIESIESETQRIASPALYDLTELQRHANRLFRFSAQKTLDLAQARHESPKLISYPRTDSRHLSRDVAATLRQVVQAIEAPYRQHLVAGTGEHPGAAVRR